jgi:Kef-type K+ transport system membrane component KefB/nucleotide-binding universal stress UspA family protein
LCLFALFAPIFSTVSAQTAPTATTQTTVPQAAEKSKAAGNGASASGKAEAILVAEIVLLMLVGRLLGEGMQRIGQPALMGQLLAGIVLGPTVFGLLWPEAQKFIFPADPAQKGMIDGVSQIGILLLLLLTGMETDLKLVRKSGFAAIAISLSGIALPFVCGFALGQYLPASLIAGGDRLVPSLFLGTALSISSIKIVAMVVREMNFMRRDLGQIIVATAIMEDTVGWVIIAITFGIAGAGGGGGGHVDLAGLGETVAGVVLFLLFCFTAGRWLVFSAIRSVNDNFRSEFPVITAILVIMGISALITQLLGVRTVLGAFMAGLLIGESPILTDHIQQQLRGMISAFFMPVFFGLSGLSANLTILGDPQLALLTLGLVLIASVGKFSGAFVGSMLGRLSGREGIALGCAMNARGSTEVIVASIGLSMGALTQHLYTMIVTMAVITTMAMPPMLRSALRRIPVRKDEEIRLAREAIDEKGFVSNLERLLLTVDESPVGRMAARLAGLLAGGQGMPITIVKLDPKRLSQDGAEEKPESGAQPPPAESDHRPQPKDGGVKEMTGARSITESGAEEAADPLAKAVKRGAKASAAKVIADEAEPDPRKVHLTTRIPADRAADLVKDEGRKGYDLLFVGLEKSRDANGKFSAAVTEIVAGFDGPVALFSHADGAEPVSLTRRSRILVPVNGSPTARRAAEVAFALARGTGAKVTALFVTRDASGIRSLKGEEGVLKDIARLGERYDAEVRTIISKRAAAAEAVLKEGRTRHSMIVMGVSPRPGEELFFGDTATQVLKNWKNPILLVAS